MVIVLILTKNLIQYYCVYFCELEISSCEMKGHFCIGYSFCNGCNPSWDGVVKQVDDALTLFCLCIKKRFQNKFVRLDSMKPSLNRRLNLNIMLMFTLQRISKLFDCRKKCKEMFPNLFEFIFSSKKHYMIFSSFCFWGFCWQLFSQSRFWFDVLNSCRLFPKLIFAF